MNESLASRILGRQSQNEIIKLNAEITELYFRISAVYALCAEAERKGQIARAGGLLSPDRVRAALKPRD